jgi:hypothetical protein
MTTTATHMSSVTCAHQYHVPWIPFTTTEYAAAIAYKSTPTPRPLAYQQGLMDGL